jgi:serine/threonine-protein kinase
MEFLEGFTLSEYIRTYGPIEPVLALGLIEQIIHGSKRSLAGRHSQGFEHQKYHADEFRPRSASGCHYGLWSSAQCPYRDDRIREDGGQGTRALAPEQRETGEVTFLADEYSLASSSTKC